MCVRRSLRSGASVEQGAVNISKSWLQNLSFLQALSQLYYSFFQLSRGLFNSFSDCSLLSLIFPTSFRSPICFVLSLRAYGFFSDISTSQTMNVNVNVDTYKKEEEIQDS